MAIGIYRHGFVGCVLVENMFMTMNAIENVSALEIRPSVENMHAVR
jgi:hypothetical protein